MIMTARRLEWPLVTLCLLLCVALLGLVIANKRRSWWLIGLAPVLALFVHHFHPPRSQRLYTLDAPEAFVGAANDPLVQDDDWVVGVVFEDQSYALPYTVLYSTPLVFITDYDKRMILMWSARANHATAWRLTHELKPRDLEIVSTPADTVLLYNRRLGKFMIALTGQTIDGEKPIGFAQPIATTKTTWMIWRRQHPATKILRAFEKLEAPTGPILPTMTGRIIDGAPADTPVTVIQTSPLLAILPDSIGKQALNTAAGPTRLLILRDPSTQRLHAFDRNVKEDLFPTFTLKSDKKHPDAIMVDSDTNSWWSADGKAVDGMLKDTKMKEIPIEENLYWGVMRYWYPKMTLSK
jgi:hypothetical protein